MRPVLLCLALSTIAPWTTPVHSQTESGYQKPPTKVVEVLTAQPSPEGRLSPDGRWLLEMEYPAMPDIQFVARPMQALAGKRIDPLLSAPFRTRFYHGLRLRPTLPTPDGPAPTAIPLPGGSHVLNATWSHDSARVALEVARDTGQELWLVTIDQPSKPTRLITGLNTTMVRPRFAPDGRHILALVHPEGRGPAPKPKAGHGGPIVRESIGETTPTRTYQDLLKNPLDEDLFIHATRAQAVLIDSQGKPRPIGKPGIYHDLSLSPDGQFLLVQLLEKPFSYVVTHAKFPRRIEVWTLDGQRTFQVADLDLEKNVPIGGVPTGPRKVQWMASHPATLIWVQAKDGGDPKSDAKHRDGLWTLAAPFTEPPAEKILLQHRLWELRFLRHPGRLITREYDRKSRRIQSHLHHLSDKAQKPLLVEERNIRDRYAHPGYWVQVPSERGKRVLHQEGDWAFRVGRGASDKGDRPFLDRFHLKSGAVERLWRCGEDSFEEVVALIPSSTGGQPSLITRHETPTSPPNLRHWNLETNSKQALTAYRDPTPSLRGIKKKRVQYQRSDGVELSGTLYLPADHEPGTALPLLLWAYPREFTDAKTAGQVSGSTQRYTRMEGSSHLIMATQGYAVLDGPSMPVIGDPETANDTFIEQIVASAQAAIDHLVELGIADPGRVAVGGHSYGAFMTANLLAHCDLFQAGIARSGAYNRTLTPFGFQAEDRDLWKAKDVYLGLSPFLFADQIDAPLLLIHGEKDNNSGTFPMQSKRMFQAIQGNGGRVRLVMLPNESHGYRARQSVLHVQAETIRWLDKHLKPTPPPKGAQATPATVPGPPPGDR